MKHIVVYTAEGKKYTVTEEEFEKLRNTVAQVDTVRIPDVRTM